MKVTFIVCAYNEEKNIDGIMNDFSKELSFVSGHELLIIDNSSKDQTFEIASQHRLIKRYSNNSVKLVRIKHCGLSESRNTAFIMAKGDYLVYVDADARLSDGFVRELLLDIESNKPDVVHGRVNNLTGANWISRFFYRTLIDQSYNSDEKPFIGAFMGFKRESLNQIGFKAGLRRGDDTLVLEELKLLGEVNKFFSQRAFVQNEFPESVLTWVQNIFKEGFYGSAINRYLRLKKKKFVFLFISFLLMIIFVITGQFALLLPYLLRVGLLLQNTVKIIQFDGYFHSTASMVLLIITVVIRDLGYVFGSIFGPDISSEFKSSKVEQVLRSNY